MSMYHTHAESKIVFDTLDKCTTKFMNSPFHKGTQMWNLLPENFHCSVNIDVFSKYIKPMYSKYVNLLEN